MRRWQWRLVGALCAWLGLGLWLHAAADEIPRAWHVLTGKTIVGAFIEVRDGMVHIRRTSDDAEVLLDPAMLSAPDRAYVQAHNAAAKATPPPTLPTYNPPLPRAPVVVAPFARYHPGVEKVPAPPPPAPLPTPAPAPLPAATPASTPPLPPITVDPLAAVPPTSTSEVSGSTGSDSSVISWGDLPAPTTPAGVSSAPLSPAPAAGTSLPPWNTLAFAGVLANKHPALAAALALCGVVVLLTTLLLFLALRQHEAWAAVTLLAGPVGTLFVSLLYPRETGTLTLINLFAWTLIGLFCWQIGYLLGAGTF